MLRRGDANGACGFVAELAERSEFGVDLVEARTDVTQDPLAGGRRRHAACGSGQQANIHPLFKGANRMTERRLRNTELGRRFGEAALASDGDEGAKVVKAASGH